MYRGLGRRGVRGLRGLGAAQAVTDPTTGQVYVVPTTTTEVNITPTGPAQYYDLTSGTPVPISPGMVPQSLTDWLNANQSTVLIGAAAFVGLLFVMKAVGR